MIQISNQILPTCSVFQNGKFIGYVDYLQLLDLRVQCKNSEEGFDIHIQFNDINREGRLIISRIDKNGRLSMGDPYDDIEHKLFKLL